MHINAATKTYERENVTNSTDSATANKGFTTGKYGKEHLVANANAASNTIGTALITRSTGCKLNNRVRQYVLYARSSTNDGKKSACDSSVTQARPSIAIVAVGC